MLTFQCVYQNHSQADPALLGLDGLPGTRSACGPLVVAQSDLSKRRDKGFLSSLYGKLSMGGVIPSPRPCRNTHHHHPPRDCEHHSIKWPPSAVTVPS